MRIKASFKHSEQGSNTLDLDQFRVTITVREIFIEQFIDKVTGKWVGNKDLISTLSQ